MKTLMKLVTITAISASMGLLTACGGGGGSKKSVTTISCSSTPHYNTTTKKWEYSQTDSRACTPLPNTTTAGNCLVGQIKVRVPVSTGSNNNLNCPVDINTGIRNCSTQGQPTMTPFYPGQVNTNYNNNSYVDPNYHTVVGQYSERCLDQGDNSLGYVYSAGSYYYVDVQQLQTDVWSYQYQYQLSGEQTLWAIGGLALLYLILQ